MVKTSTKTTKDSPAKKKTGSPKPSSGKKKGTAEARILSALAQELCMGEAAPTKARIASLANMTNNEGSYKTFLGILKRKGLINYDKDTVSLTDTGKVKVGPELSAVPKTNKEFHEKIKEAIKMKKGREIFDFLADGRSRSFAEIANAIGVNEGNASLKTYITSVTKYTDKSNSSNGKKMFSLNDSCFPFEPRPADQE